MVMAMVMVELIIIIATTTKNSVSVVSFAKKVAQYTLVSFGK